jgi:hypothetical protein
VRSLLVQGELPPEELAGLLPAVGADVQTSVGYAFGTVRVFLYVGRKFTFRSSDYLGLTLLAASDGKTQRIDVSYAGGGAGLMGIEWGAGRSLETSLVDAVVAALGEKSLQYSEVPAPDQA